MSVLLACLAATAAYTIAAALFGAENAFFAPIAAVIIVGLGGGERFRRSLELAGGVLVGVLAGESVSLLPLSVPMSLALTILVAMGVAVALRPTSLFTNQAAVAGVVTLVLTPITQAPPFLRLGDALVGGVVAIVVALPAVVRPGHTLRTAALAATGDLASSLDEVAGLLRDESSDPDTAVRAVLTGARSAGSLDDAVRQARESLRVGRHARELRWRLGRTARMRDEWLDLVTSLASIARAARGMRRDAEQSDTAALRITDLADALRDLGNWVGSAEPSDAREAVRTHLVSLGASLTGDLRDDIPSKERVLLIAARSAVVDLLRMTGMSHPDAVAAATA